MHKTLWNKETCNLKPEFQSKPLPDPGFGWKWAIPKLVAVLIKTKHDKLRELGISSFQKKTIGCDDASYHIRCAVTRTSLIFLRTPLQKKKEQWFVIILLHGFLLHNHVPSLMFWLFLSWSSVSQNLIYSKGWKNHPSVGRWGTHFPRHPDPKKKVAAL